MRRCRNPSRPEHRRNVEKQHIPESHLFAKLPDRIGRIGIGGAVCGLAHKVTSSAGISSTCLRKFTMKGSSEFSNPPHGPKYVTRPSCRKTTVSASFFARCVSCVTTIEVL